MTNCIEETCEHDAFIKSNILHICLFGQIFYISAPVVQICAGVVLKKKRNKTRPLRSAGGRKVEMSKCSWRWALMCSLRVRRERQAEQVTPFSHITAHQKFFQVSFCVAEDDNGESINAWNEKKPPVWPRGERFHTRQPPLNSRHSSLPLLCEKEEAPHGLPPILSCIRR